jgi:hypothetical protein
MLGGIKLKKAYTLLVAIILLVAVILVKYYNVPKTPLEICSIKESAIDSIILVNGGDGNQTEIVDKDKISEIMKMLDSSKYKYVEKNELNGFVLNIKLFSS